MRLLHFILSHSIFIALCAVGLCFQTSLLLTIPNNYLLYGFIFFATISSYNFYWLISKFHFSSTKLYFTFLKANISFIISFLISAIFTIYFLFNLTAIFPYIVLAIILMVFYTFPLLPFSFIKKLQQFGFFKTVLLSFTWAYIVTVLPVVAYKNDLYFLIQTSNLLLFSTTFFFILLLCIVFDSRDVEIDKLHGLHSLATDVSSNNLYTLIQIAFFLFLSCGLLFCAFTNNYSEIVGYILLGILFWIVYYQSLKKQGFVFYYFIVDGLMLLSAIIIFISSLF